uniref:Uncharacterized protein n=1 Tax=Tanacetum cinerariifolium TaxID=118510 RepID=A0A6L2NFH4_TANCI|nr:hypothetical protein [Tanacetum cinerariifolium]
MWERHEVNYIKSEDYLNQNSYDSFSQQSLHDPNDSEKSLKELNNDVKNDLENFKRRIRSMRTVHWKLFSRDDGKTTGVLPNKESKTVKQEPQSKTELKNWSEFQKVPSKQTNRTEPPPPLQAHTEHVNAIFTGCGKSDDPLNTQKDPPLSILVKNKTEKYKPIKTSKKGYHVVKTNEYPFRNLSNFVGVFAGNPHETTTRLLGTSRGLKACGSWIGGWHFTLGDLYN